MLKRSCLLIALLLPAFAWAQDLVLTQPYARATPPGVPNGAVFFELYNRGTETIGLTAAHSEVAERTEIHEHVAVQGMMRMREVEGLSIGPGERLRFQPGGRHIMLLGLKQPLKPGERFDLSLELDNGERLEFEAPVRDMRAGQGMKGSHGQHSGRGHTQPGVKR